ncbi:MAG: OmpA family protein [Proteobacteria bacterium]|nr:OmpA family protein [Pseudomonadota bacterium]HQR02986.1 OmpA family protein [Rhodocyclaceae bacterium]
MKTAQISLLVAALLGISASAFAQTPGVDLKGTVGYVIDQRGYVAKSGTGLCWRDGFWTPALAIEECDPDLVKKPEPPKPAPAPVAPPKPAAEKITLSADALFDFDKADLKPEGKEALDGLAAKLQGIKLEVIIAVGHADRIGKPTYNQSLSERRAASVKAYLVGKGIEDNRVYTEGKGSTEPVTGDKCGTSKVKTKKLIACLQPDRRVNIEVIGTKAQ